jgi:hypothetical protein
MANFTANALLRYIHRSQLDAQAHDWPGGPSDMDLSQQSYDNKSLVDAADESEVLNLTSELVSLPECSEEFSRVMVSALDEWDRLLDGRKLPPAAAIDLANEKLLSAASILFDVSADPRRPEILRIGPQIPLLIETAENGNEDSWFSAELLRDQLVDFCVRAVSCREPFDFDLDRRDGKSISNHGMMLPFSNDGEAIDHVLCILDVAEPRASVHGALQAVSTDPEQETVLVLDELLLEDETDPTADELLLEQEFEPEEMPNLADSKEQDGAEPFLIISVENQSASLRPTKKFAPDYSFAPLPRAARGLAEAANVSQARSRRALYRAIGSAFDFARAAAEAPDDFAAIIGKAGLKMQERAPMTPVVKLVFGTDYDKGRLAEYAAALSHAHRLGLKSGTLEDYLLAAPGGLKEIVRTERAWRRSTTGKPELKSNRPHEKLARKLRALPVQSFADLAPEGDEFVLILARRDSQTGVSVVGEVPRDLAMLDRAARKLLAEKG